MKRLLRSEADSIIQPVRLQCVDEEDPLVSFSLHSLWVAHRVDPKCPLVRIRTVILDLSLQHVQHIVLFLVEPVKHLDEIVVSGAGLSHVAFGDLVLVCEDIHTSCDTGQD